MTAGGGGGHSPSKIPARVPLGNMPHGNNSPERGMSAMAREHMTQSRSKLGHGNNQNQPPPPAMAPPPMMRSYYHPPPSASAHPPSTTHYDDVDHDNGDPRCTSAASSSQDSVRNIPPEDIYNHNHNNERSQCSYLQSSTIRTNPMPPPMGPPPSTIRANITTSTTTTQHYPHHHHHAPPTAMAAGALPPRAESRQISTTSSAMNTVSSSENWETYDDASEPEEPEPDASEGYYARLRAARGKGYTSEVGKVSPGRKMHGLRGGVGVAPGSGHTSMMETEAGRMVVVSGSDAGWVDEEAF